jgi:hypothetical protein
MFIRKNLNKKYLNPYFPIESLLRLGCVGLDAAEGYDGAWTFGLENKCQSC